MPAITQWKDGDEPDRLIEETTGALDVILESFKEPAESALCEGVSVLILLTTNDPLTGMNHIAYTSRGNIYASMGAAQMWLVNQTQG